jgi:uncharacterized protein (TIGR03790 family)
MMTLLISTTLVLTVSKMVLALEPGEIVVVANRNMDQSIALARGYMKKRHIPTDQLLTLNVSKSETCTQDEYQKKIAPALRGFIKIKSKAGRHIRCVVLMYGMPLRISATTNYRIIELQQQKARLIEKMAAIVFDDNDQNEDVKNELKRVKKEIRLQQFKTTKASLDSEIALVQASTYALEGWIPNPFFIGNQERLLTIDKSQVLMVSRLDGPTPQTVGRIIDDTLQAEKKGLTGNAYFDARWPESRKKPKGGYQLYDYSIHQSARRLKDSQLMPTILNKGKDLFGPGEAPNAALYCGWYRLANYVDAFTWQPGAIGYHIASAECTTLKKANSRVWCKMMLEKGIAATLGPVAEPYVQAFPLPEVFFSCLIDGYLTLCECYFVGLPYVSWQMVLIGDPLYRPFNALHHPPTLERR